MSDKYDKFMCGDFIVALESYKPFITKGVVYQVVSIPQHFNKDLICIVDDRGYETDLYASRFEIKEEDKVSEVEKEQYIEHSTGRVYDLVFKGNRTYVLRCVSDEQEVCCYESHLKSIFTPITKEMQKQQKKNEDLYTLSTVTDEIIKLLDDNYVICHANVNCDTRGLVEFTVMLGESV